MITQRLYPCLFVILFLLGNLAEATEYYNFTNAEGQTLRAKFLRMQGSRVEIQREDGAKFIVDPALFVEKDRKYIAEQTKQQLLARDDVLKIRAVSSETRKDRDTSDEALIIENYKGFYKIKISNTSDVELKNLNVEYRYYVFSNEMGGDRRNSGRTTRTAGKTKVPVMPARGEVDLQTDMTNMRDTKLKPGWTWSEGGKRSSSDQLKGIWLRVYMGDKLLCEFSNPTALKEKESW